MLDLLSLSRPITVLGQVEYLQHGLSYVESGVDESIGCLLSANIELTDCDCRLPLVAETTDTKRVADAIDAVLSYHMDANSRTKHRGNPLL